MYIYKQADSPTEMQVGRKAGMYIGRDKQGIFEF